MSDLMNDSIGMSFGTRLHTPEFAKPRWPAATFCRPQWQRIAFHPAGLLARDNLRCRQSGVSRNRSWAGSGPDRRRDR